MVKKFRICKTCRIPHIENCDTCFGFGKYMYPDACDSQRLLTAGSVHRIIENHQGMIKVESEVGRGSTFAIFLPADEDEEKHEC